MKVIYKYELNDLAKREIELPVGAEMLTVQMQHGAPQLWALVDTEAKMEKRRILIVGTGHPIEQHVKRYVATFQMMNGALVFHVFEI